MEDEVPLEDEALCMLREEVPQVTQWCYKTSLCWMMTLRWATSFF